MDPIIPKSYISSFSPAGKTLRPLKYLEKGLMKEDGSTNRGAFGRAVRLISDSEYQVILQFGFEKPSKDQSGYAGQMVVEEPAEAERFSVYQLVSRPFRDAAFAKNVRTIYDYTCAMSGLRLINGGGRPEVEAAHIRPVGNDHHGPDSVRNGIALSRSIHWMFDRGLLSLSDSYEILMARRLVPDSVKRLLNPDGMLLTPADLSFRPHPQFLRYHREHIFKG